MTIYTWGDSKFKMGLSFLHQNHIMFLTFLTPLLGLPLAVAVLLPDTLFEEMAVEAPLLLPPFPFFPKLNGHNEKPRLVPGASVTASMADLKIITMIPKPIDRDRGPGRNSKATVAINLAFVNVSASSSLPRMAIADLPTKEGASKTGISTL